MLLSFSAQDKKETKPTPFYALITACTNGVLEPHSLQCGLADTPKIQDNEVGYLGEIEFVSSNQEIAGILSGFNKVNDRFGHGTLSASSASANSGSYYQHNFGSGKACGMPKKLDDTIIYK